MSLAEKADLSIVFASDRHSEGVDSNIGLSLPGDQDAVISRIAKRSKKTVVILNTNSAVLMPWIEEVDAVMQSWYGGQQIGLALERLLFGDVRERWRCYEASSNIIQMVFASTCQPWCYRGR